MEMNILAELWYNITHSTTYGIIGVGGIFVYMAIIVTTAIYRIFKGDHLDHH